MEALNQKMAEEQAKRDAELNAIEEARIAAQAKAEEDARAKAAAEKAEQEAQMKSAGISFKSSGQAENKKKGKSGAAKKFSRDKKVSKVSF